MSTHLIDGGTPAYLYEHLDCQKPISIDALHEKALMKGYASTEAGLAYLEMHGYARPMHGGYVRVPEHCAITMRVLNRKRNGEPVMRYGVTIKQLQEYIDAETKKESNQCK